MLMSREEEPNQARESMSSEEELNQARELRRKKEPNQARIRMSKEEEPKQERKAMSRRIRRSRTNVAADSCCRFAFAHRKPSPLNLGFGILMQIVS
jgi:hypothetical protein